MLADIFLERRVVVDAHLREHLRVVLPAGRDLLRLAHQRELASPVAGLVAHAGRGERQQDG